MRSSAINVLYQLLLLSIVFGGLLSRTTIVFPTSVAREAILWTLLLLLFGAGRITPLRRLGRPIFVSLVALALLIVIGAVTTFVYSFDVRSISNKWAVLYKFAQFHLFLVCFLGYQRATGRTAESLCKWLVIYLAIYALVTPVIYFMPPALMIENFRWWGRFGVGYPTMDAQLFVSGIAMLLFGRLFTGWVWLALFACCMMGLALQVTATGMATLVAVLGIKGLSNPKSAIPYVFSIFVSAVVGWWVVTQVDPAITDNASTLLGMKLQALQGAGDDASLSIRQDQYNELLQLLRGDVLAEMLGIGVGIYVENQYGFFRVAFGHLGLATFIAFLFVVACEGLRRFRGDHGLMLAGIMIFALSSYTLTTFYLFPLTATLALIFVVSAEHLSQRGAGERTRFRRAGELPEVAA